MTNTPPDYKSPWRKITVSRDIIRELTGWRRRWAILTGKPTVELIRKHASAYTTDDQMQLWFWVNIPYGAYSDGIEIPDADLFNVKSWEERL